MPVSDQRFETYDQMLERQTLLEACPWPWTFDDCEFVIRDADERKILRIAPPHAKYPMGRQGYDQDIIGAGLMAIGQTLAQPPGFLPAALAYRVDPAFQRMLSVAPRLWRKSVFGETGDVLDGNGRHCLSFTSTRGESEQEWAIKAKILVAVNGT